MQIRVMQACNFTRRNVTSSYSILSVEDRHELFFYFSPRHQRTFSVTQVK